MESSSGEPKYSQVQLRRMREQQENSPRISVREQLAANRRASLHKGGIGSGNRSTMSKSNMINQIPKQQNKQKETTQKVQEPIESHVISQSVQETEGHLVTDNSAGNKEEKSEQYISTRRSKAPIKTKQFFQAEKRPPMTFSKPKDFSDRGEFKAKPGGAISQVNRRNKDDTFGDMERKAVKVLREKYQSNRDDLVENYRKLAEIYSQSGIGTENIYNILRASGLYNICLTLLQDEDDDRSEQILETLIEMETTALKRVIKLKPNYASKFDHTASQQAAQNGLKCIRDIYDADFSLLVNCICELPDMQAILETEPLNDKQLVAEDKIIALGSMMSAEVFTRKKVIITEMVAESIEILGPLPCNFALSSCGSTYVNHAPYGGLSCFLLIEQDSPSIKSYFRNLLSLVVMKMMNIGETCLSQLNIRSLHWMKTELKIFSGSGLLSFMDDVDKKNLPKIFIERIRSAVDLLCSATSNKAAEREDVFEVSDGPSFICGDLRLFKELSTVRQTVVQREQADIDHRDHVLDTLQSLIIEVDPFNNIAITDDYENMLQKGVLDLPEKFLHVLFEMEKNLTSEDSKTRLEEMMPTNYVPLNASLTIATTVDDGKMVTRFLNDTDNMMSPRSPNIHSTRKSKQWWHEGLDRMDPRASKDTTTWNAQTSHNVKALKELKLKKRDSGFVGSDFYRGFMVKPTGESVGYTHPQKRQSQITLSASDDDRDEESSMGFTTQIQTQNKVSSRIPAEPLHPTSIVRRRAPIPPPVDPSVVQPKNASNRIRASEAPLRKSREVTPPPKCTSEKFDRLVTSVPVYNGKPRNVLTDDTVHNLTLLNCLTTVIKQSRQNSVTVTSNIPPQLDKKVLDMMYLKILQIVLPLIEHLRPMVKNTRTIQAVRKSLSTMDLSPVDNELAVALACFHNMKYQKACKAVYSYIENRSDITFIGEPFPCDLTEVCQELLDENEITKERYQSIHTLLGLCHMRRGNHEDALSCWKELLTVTSEPEKLAETHNNMATSYIQVEMWEEAIQSISKAIELYRSFLKDSKKAKVMLIKLRDMKTEVESVRELKTKMQP